MAASIKSFCEGSRTAPAGRQQRRASWLRRLVTRDEKSSKSVVRVLMGFEDGGGVYSDDGRTRAVISNSPSLRSAVMMAEPTFPPGYIVFH